MHDDTEWSTFYNAFFAAHPEWLDAVKYRHIEGSDEPQMLMSTAGMRAFLQWVQAHPLISYNPQKLTATLAQLDALEGGTV